MSRMWSFIVFFFLGLLVLCPPANAQSAEQLLSAGQADQAMAVLQAKIKANPNDAESHNLLCRVYFALNEWDRAIGFCESAVSLQPQNGRYHLWLGRAYGEKADSSNFIAAAGLVGKVRGEFETAVRLGPDDVAARTDLAEFYLEAPGIAGGGQDKAVAQAQTLEKLDPAGAQWVIGRIAEKNHDKVTAEREYRSAIEGTHGSAIAWLNLAFFYRRIHRYSEMEDAINHASAAEMNHPEVLVEAAETLIRAGRNFPGAAQLLQRYLSSSTVEAAPAFKAHYLLGTVLEKQGDRHDAAQEYRAALSMARDFSRAREALDRVNR
jgi:tetratricopeptide (TPR) repeat protein